MTDDVRQPGMIASMSLRLLYLIFQKVLGLILLLGRTSSTKDVELLRRALQRASSASGAAVAAAAPDIAGSRAGSWQDPASTDPGRPHQRVRDGSLKPLIRHHGPVLEPEPGSDEHAEAVRDLWIFLRANGINAQIDRVATQRRQDWALWMEQQIDVADHILIVASPAYRQRAGTASDPEVGRGVQYEARLIRNLFYKNQTDLQRVLPGGSADDLPAFLNPRSSTVYTVSGFTVAGAEALLRVLHRKPGDAQPGLGAKSPEARPHTQQRTRPEPLRHQIEVAIGVGESGIETTVSLAGSALGPTHQGWLPLGIEHCWDNLDIPTAVNRLARVGTSLSCGLHYSTTPPAAAFWS